MSENFRHSSNCQWQLTFFEKTLDEIDAPVASGLEEKCQRLTFQEHHQGVYIKTEQS